jgi:hypothetical protein
MKHLFEVIVYSFPLLVLGALALYFNTTKGSGPRVLPFDGMPHWPWCKSCGKRLRPCTHGVPSNWHHVHDGSHHHEDGSVAWPR